MKCNIKVGDKITWSNEFRETGSISKWNMIDDIFTVIDIKYQEYSISIYLDKNYLSSNYMSGLPNCYIATNTIDGIPCFQNVKVFELIENKSNYFCPLCGWSAEVLFISVECSNPQCQNKR